MVSSSEQPVRVAVVTGNHPFDVPAFHALFRSTPGIDAYVQHLEDYAGSSAEVRAGYDVVLFYNMHTETPTGKGPWPAKATRAAVEALGDSRPGIFVLHHAILAYPEWPLWSELVGIPDRRFGYHHGERIRVDVASPDHPITRGLASWEMVDETYTMADAGPDAEVLLTVEHPRSMRTIAWTRRFREALVFCLELGHDAAAYADPAFRTVVARGIQWCAGRT